MNNIRIVLVETSHPANIGSCVRAMKTMGIYELYLVKPKQFPHPQAVELAAGADDLLANAHVVASLAQALQGIEQVFMTSARARNIALPGFTPKEAALKIVNDIGSAKVALVFGRERTGLTNAELLQGHYHVYIPANPEYSSLNISQAVQIICYELRMHKLKPKANVTTQQEKAATYEAIERFFIHLEEVLQEIGFLRDVAPRKLMERMRRLFGRIQLEEPEVNLLRGMLNRVQYSLKVAKGKMRAK